MGDHGHQLCPVSACRGSVRIHVLRRIAGRRVRSQAGDQRGEQSLESADEYAGPNMLVPGERTSALATLRMMCSGFEFDWAAVEFETIGDRVVAGEADAGVLIHEGQLTYADQGLHLVADLGAWWETGDRPAASAGRQRDSSRSGGPVGARNAPGDHIDSASIRTVGTGQPGTGLGTCDDLRTRDRSGSCADEFVEMYVNRWTLDFEDRGRQAVRRFLRPMPHEVRLSAIGRGGGFHHDRPSSV